MGMIDVSYMYVTSFTEPITPKMGIKEVSWVLQDSLEVSWVAFLNHAATRKAPPPSLP
jgi:hypothetical protein